MEHGAVDALQEVVHHEDRDGVVHDLLTEVRLPPQARVHGDAVRCSPRVLAVPPRVPVLDVQDIRTAMLDARDAADHEIRQRASSDMTVNDPVTAGARGRGEVAVPELNKAAEAKLMAAFDQRHVVRKRVHRVELLPLGRLSRLQRKGIVHRQRELSARRIAEELDADVARLEQRVLIALDVGPVDGDARRVDERGAQDHRVADAGRVHQVVAARRVRRQDVLTLAAVSRRNGDPRPEIPAED